VLAGCALLLTRSSGPVTVAAPSPDPVQARRCAEVLALLPTRLAGAPRRATTPASPFTLAYDTDPPQTVRCGTDGSDLLPADTTYIVDRVVWTREAQLGRGGTMRTWSTRRAPGLELRVPDGAERDLIDGATDALLGVRR